ncbi:MAG: NHL domain-containing protein, partial [Bacteroidia bacterium]
GNVYVTDAGNQRIRKINSKDTISTIAGNGTAGYAGDSAQAVNALISSPRGITVDMAGNVYFTEPTNQCIRQIVTGGMIRTFAGVGLTSGYSGDGGPAINATFDLPYGVKSDTAGNIYVADFGNDCIRMVNKSGKISTIAGNGNQGFSGDKGLAINARLNAPMDVVVANDKTIYIADFNNFRVRAVCNGACFLGVGELKENELSVSLYPNPNNGNFNLTISGDPENAELVIVNTLGEKMLHRKMGHGINLISTPGLAKGIYYYAVSHDNTRLAAGKIVIE